MRYGTWAIVALTALLLSSPLQAQWSSGGGDVRGGGGMPGGGGPGGGGPGGRRGMMGGPPGPRMDIPTPDELEGPLVPKAMASIADLDSAGASRYGQLYAPHMAATAPVRDSLRLILKSMREGRNSDDPDGMRAEMEQRRPVISRLWKDLRKQDEQFYKTATKGFTKDQRNNFEKWQDEEKKARDAERPRGPGGGRPGWT